MLFPSPTPSGTPHHWLPGFDWVFSADFSPNKPREAEKEYRQTKHPQTVIRRMYGLSSSMPCMLLTFLGNPGTHAIGPVSFLSHIWKWQASLGQPLLHGFFSRVSVPFTRPCSMPFLLFPNHVLLKHYAGVACPNSIWRSEVPSTLARSICCRAVAGLPMFNLWFMPSSCPQIAAEHHTEG